MSQVSNSQQAECQTPQPRARAVIEFIEADFSRPPIVYPASGGTDEQDEALRKEILKRWTRG